MKSIDLMEGFMIYNNKKLTILALMSMMPFFMISGPIDASLAVGQAVASIGKVATTIDRACQLSECQTPKPIAFSSDIYNLGSLTHFFGSLLYKTAVTPYRLCCGFPEVSNTLPAITLCDKVNTALHGVSTLKTVLNEGYELMPDSAKWAVSSAIPFPVKEICKKTEKFIHDSKCLKLMTLSAYVAYKASLDRTTMADTISNAYGEVAMIKFFGRLGNSLLPDSVKNAVPVSVKSKFDTAKDFINEHKLLKGVAFVGYVAYKLSKQNPSNVAYNSEQQGALKTVDPVNSFNVGHDQLANLAMAVTS